MSCLVIKDQISHLVDSFAQASLTASSCVNFLLNEQAGAGCRQQEHADWQPQRRSHAFDCFRFLFYFPSSRRSNQETIQRSIPSDEWTESLILSQQIVIFSTFTQFFSLCFLWICYNSFCFPQKDLFRIDRCRTATTTEVGGQLKLERRWIFQRWIGGLNNGRLTGEMRPASGQSATPGCQSAGLGSIGQLGQGVGVSHLLT